MEKVENLYRTARAQNDSINTSDNQDHACATRGVRPVVVCDRAARRDESMKAGSMSSPGDRATPAMPRQAGRSRRRAADRIARPCAAAASMPAGPTVEHMRRQRAASAIRRSPLPDMSHFAAEFLRILRRARRSDPLQRSLKFGPYPSQASCDAACSALGCADPNRKSRGSLTHGVFTTLARR